MKVLVATDKPFAKVAVDGIRKEIEAAGYELALLEKYGDKAKLPLQPSPFQPPCLEIQTTASANSTANITSVMIPRSVIFIPRFLLYGFLPQVYTIYRQRATACRTFFVQGAADAAARR